MQPPIGLYNSDLIFSINYNNQKKVKQNSKLDNIGFSSCINKKPNENKIDDIGPGYYYREKKVKVNETHPPFATSEKKLKENYQTQFLTGPGQYNIDSYFDWNKRTFNVNFI